MAANAGDIGEKALKGAVAGAVLTEITGGDAKDGLALGAAAGALGGKIAEDRDRQDRKDDRKKGGNKHKR
ncbi:glycine zipper domain-containing protein [Ruegeria arenilitoris]|uniref:glycine zipper domain-containing protein n=2 Tax=Roseobacteraceae TaxID=2854170 RepID=UPI00147FCEE7|nr:glycine zipper domain-containing protein [Ruegeria arenilitoris]